MDLEDRNSSTTNDGTKKQIAIKSLRNAKTIGLVPLLKAALPRTAYPENIICTKIKSAIGNQGCSIIYYRGGNVVEARDSQVSFRLLHESSYFQPLRSLSCPSFSSVSPLGSSARLER